MHSQQKPRNFHSPNSAKNHQPEQVLGLWGVVFVVWEGRGQDVGFGLEGLGVYALALPDEISRSEVLGLVRLQADVQLNTTRVH